MSQTRRSRVWLLKISLYYKFPRQFAPATVQPTVPPGPAGTRFHPTACQPGPVPSRPPGAKPVPKSPVLS